MNVQDLPTNDNILTAEECMLIEHVLDFYGDRVNGIYADPTKLESKLRRARSGLCRGDVVWYSTPPGRRID